LTQEVRILTEPQMAALDKPKADKEPHDDFERR
jgi:hypothetical protein